MCSNRHILGMPHTTISPEMPVLITDIQPPMCRLPGQTLYLQELICTWRLLGGRQCYSPNHVTFQAHMDLNFFFSTRIVRLLATN